MVSYGIRPHISSVSLVPARGSFLASMSHEMPRFRGFFFFLFFFVVARPKTGLLSSDNVSTEVLYICNSEINYPTWDKIHHTQDSER